MDRNVSKNTICYKFLKLNVNKGYLAIKNLIKHQLLESIQLYNSKIGLNAEFNSLEALITDKIALCHFDRVSLQNIVYRCAIAFPLGNYWDLSPLTVAQNLQEFLLIADVTSATKPILGFKVRVVSPGWIDFHLSDRSLAVWLEELVDWVSQDGEDRGDGGDREDENLFVIQYAHARCCSLMRLGHQEKLIKIKYKYSVWEIVQPIKFTWVDDRDTFWFKDPTEKRLLIQLLIVVEALITNSQKVNWVKLAGNLSESFLDFWAECRIYGEVKQKTPKLAQARLGLVALTQYFLYRILRDKLDVSPLTKL